MMPDRSMLRVLRLVLGAAARREGVDENLIDDVRLGVVEAVAEGIEVHRGMRTAEPIAVEFDFSAATVDVRVSHVMPEGSPTSEERGAADPIAVISGIADEVDVGRDGDRRVTISMRWRQGDTRVWPR